MRNTLDERKMSKRVPGSVRRIDPCQWPATCAIVVYWIGPIKLITLCCGREESRANRLMKYWEKDRMLSAFYVGQAPDRWERLKPRIQSASMGRANFSSIQLEEDAIQWQLI